jgi:putative nucleotidyltransferase with HDIG domain
MEKNKINKIKKIVEKMADREDWKFHILPVIQYSKRLAKELKVNEEIAELAALLHDIGRIKFGGENHQITGAKEAEKILKKYKFEKKIIEEIKNCIEYHRGSTDIKPKTKLAKIIANADVMAHFDNFLVLVYYGAQRKFRYEETIEWLNKKIERDWEKKLTLKIARKLMREKYKAIKLLINSTKKYF